MKNYIDILGFGEVPLSYSESAEEILKLRKENKTLKFNLDWDRADLASEKCKSARLQRELDAAVDHHDESGIMIENALCGDGFECENWDVSRFEGYARRINALMKIYNITENALTFLENQVIKGWEFVPDRNFLEQIHVTLQGDLSHNKVGVAKKMIEDALGGSPCEPPTQKS